MKTTVADRNGTWVKTGVWIGTQKLQRLIGHKSRCSSLRSCRSTFVCSLAIVFLFGLHENFALRYNYGDGSYYVGQVDENGRPRGFGKFYNTSGALEYEGEFVEGLLHGTGLWHSRDGSTFQGTFQNGRSKGPGILRRSNGDRIQGEFVDLKPNGRMIFAKSDNGHNSTEIVRMEGEFKHGMAHGHLNLWIRQNKTLLKIEGPFRMGRPNGIVTISTIRSLDDHGSPQIVYEGRFSNGRRMAQLSPESTTTSNENDKNPSLSSGLNVLRSIVIL